MTVETRVEALRTRHIELERKLEDEENRPMPDEELLHTIKREKLQLKDEMMRLGAS